MPINSSATTSSTPSPSPLSSPLPELGSANDRRTFLTAILYSCTPAELVYISETIAPMLKYDFLSSLPPELGLHILSFVEHPLTLIRMSAVSRVWRSRAVSEELWRAMCIDWGFGDESGEHRHNWRDVEEEPLEEMEPFAELPMDPALEWLTERKRRARRPPSGSSQSGPASMAFSYCAYFKESFSKMVRWRKGGQLLRAHQLPMLSSLNQLTSSSYPKRHASSPQPVAASEPPQTDTSIVTCVALDNEWVVVGLANSRIHIFSARSGVLARTLVGHESGVWGLCLVSASRPMNHEGKGKAREMVQSEDLNSTDMPKMKTTRRKQANGTTESGLAYSLPPSLRAAVGLDLENELDDKLDSDKLDFGPANEYEDEEAGNQSSDLPHYTPERQSNPCFASEGWGQPNALVVSGGCDKVVKVWDVKSGHCIYTLPGHTSTIRCMRTLHGRPLAVTGSRDHTVRTWDIQRGVAVHVLEGHGNSVRCLDVNGNRAASGSYDSTCRIWDLDTGQCIHVLQGHYHEVYSVAFDGVLVATGGLDTSVRVWDADTGHCLALLQGHTSLVCQLQLSRKQKLLATGDSNGKVIMFSLESFDEFSLPSVSSWPFPDSKGKWTKNQKNWKRKKKSSRDKDATQSSSSSASDSETSDGALSMWNRMSKSAIPAQTRTPYEPLYHLAAHSSSVTSLQFDKRFLVTSGNDGCVYLWETQTGKYVRRMTEPGGVVWKVGFTGGKTVSRKDVGEWEEDMGDVCVIAGQRLEKSILEIWGYGKAPPDLF